MKIFISQAMNGLTDEEILAVREKAIKDLKECYGEDIEILDTFFNDDVPEDVGPLWYLGKSIQMMDQADLVYFVKGAHEARGCRVERPIVEEYMIKYLDEDFLKLIKNWIDYKINIIESE